MGESVKRRIFVGESASIAFNADTGAAFVAKTDAASQELLRCLLASADASDATGEVEEEELRLLLLFLLLLF